MPTAGADFVYNMERVLEVYARPYDVSFPVVCYDESPKQLVSEVREGYTDDKGVKHEDCEYKPEGAAEIIMIVEPLGAQRQVLVQDDHTGNTWAKNMAYIADEMYPKAQKVTIVMDNLSAHKPANLYNIFLPEKAKQILDRIEFVFTPKHGSWLNIAECELSVLSRQALQQRFPDKSALTTQVNSWFQKRNNLQKGIDWQFKTKDARIKLKRLYPTVLT
ncbi:MAG: IS630 family transposase [Bacteroidales bacterium]